MANNPNYEQRLSLKSHNRQKDEWIKPLGTYRDEELQHMKINFYRLDQTFHGERHNFVHKKAPSQTPLRLAKHRAVGQALTTLHEREVGQKRQAPTKTSADTEDDRLQPETMPLRLSNTLGTAQGKMSSSNSEENRPTSVATVERDKALDITRRDERLTTIQSAYDAGNYTEALRLLKPLADQGHARAQAELGYMYGTGHGVAKDYGEAVRWYRKAAEQGDADAQNNLGFMYEHGHGVAKDHREAAKWYRRLAE